MLACERHCGHSKLRAVGMDDINHFAILVKPLTALVSQSLSPDAHENVLLKPSQQPSSRRQESEQEHKLTLTIRFKTFLAKLRCVSISS